MYLHISGIPENVVSLDDLWADLEQITKLEIKPPERKQMSDIATMRVMGGHVFEVKRVLQARGYNVLRDQDSFIYLSWNGIPVDTTGNS